MFLRLSRPLERAAYSGDFCCTAERESGQNGNGSGRQDGVGRAAVPVVIGGGGVVANTGADGGTDAGFGGGVDGGDAGSDAEQAGRVMDGGAGVGGDGVES